MSNKTGKWYVYMLVCKDDTFYTGITNAMNLRMQKHREGRGSKYVYGRLPFKVVYVEDAKNRSEASKRELFLKGLRHHQKVNMANLYKRKYGEYKE